MPGCSNRHAVNNSVPNGGTYLHHQALIVDEKNIKNVTQERAWDELAQHKCLFFKEKNQMESELTERADWNDDRV